MKGKGQASDPTPEASGAGGGNPLPPPRRIAAGAPGGGGDPNDEGEESGREPDEKWRGRPNERPAPQPEDHYDAPPENDEHLNLCSRVRANALGQDTRVLAEPPAQFKNEKHQDIHMLLLTCTWSSLQGGQVTEKRGPLALFATPPHSTAWGGESFSAFPAPVPAQVQAPPIPQPGPH